MNCAPALEFGRTNPELNGQLAGCRQKSECRRTTSDLSVKKADRAYGFQTVQVFGSPYGFFAMQLNDPAIGHKNLKSIVRTPVCGQDAKSGGVIVTLETEFGDQPLNYLIARGNPAKVTALGNRAINSGIAQ